MHEIFKNKLQQRLPPQRNSTIHAVRWIHSFAAIIAVSQAGEQARRDWIERTSQGETGGEMRGKVACRAGVFGWASDE